MILTVFGASGRSGWALIELAIANGYTVRAFVRNAKKLQAFKEKIVVFEGEFLNTPLLEKAIEGSDAVINLLGHVRNTPAFFQTNATAAILQAMQKVGVERIIALTGSGVFFQGDQPTWFDTVLSFILRWVAKDRWEDGLAMAKLFQKSDLKWTLLRATLLTQGALTKNVGHGNVGAKHLSMAISRKDVAYFCLQIINDKSSFQTAPYIGTIQK